MKENAISALVRITWASHQRAEKELNAVITAKEMKDGFRLAPDQVLEREIRQHAPCPPKWLPVVPDGQCTRHLTWKRWLFLQFHVGFLGAHKNEDKTENIMSRLCWWRTMRKDIKSWIDEMKECMRSEFGKMKNRSSWYLAK